jgi:SAM-dependent methyltransferase
LRDDHRELNRRWWDERVPIHVRSAYYDVEAFKRGEGSLRPFELEEVGDVAGKRLLHLQCHFGLDTLSWARLGASVVGVDFSAPAVEAANELAAETRLDGRFVQADVYEAADVLGGERFDIVYTGLGALNWLNDLERWGRVVASLLREGGFLYLAEFHPFAAVFADEDLSVVYDYFHDPAGVRLEDDGGSYADLSARTEQNATQEWAHPISEVLDVLLSNDLRLELFHEHDYTLSPGWPHLIEEERGVYRQPKGRPRLPLMFSLRARRPRASAPPPARETPAGPT